MDFKSFEDVVQFAIEREREAARFYRKAAETEKFEVDKRVLNEHAEEEEKHEQILKEFKADKSAVAKYKLRKFRI